MRKFIFAEQSQSDRRTQVLRELNAALNAQPAPVPKALADKKPKKPKD
jgi:hypothetical protein